MSKISLFPEGKISQKTGKLAPSSIPFTNIEFEDYLDINYFDLGKIIRFNRV